MAAARTAAAATAPIHNAVFEILVRATTGKAILPASLDQLDGPPVSCEFYVRYIYQEQTAGRNTNTRAGVPHVYGIVEPGFEGSFQKSDRKSLRRRKPSHQRAAEDG